MMDSYFAKSNTNNPVGSYLTDIYYYPINWNNRHDIDIYLAENQLELSDDILGWSDPKNEKFYSIEDERTIFRNVYNNNFTMYFNVKLDQIVHKHQRSMYTISDALSATGGVHSIGVLFLSFIIGYFVDILYNYKILES